MGMMWFIFSEVMFFVAFFGALFYARRLSVPWLGGEGVKIFNNIVLWPGFENHWPTNGPGHVGGRADSTFSTIPAFGIPALNTAILLTSGVTVTIAHHALRAGKRGVLTVFLAATFLLGFTFVALQAHEYGEAYKDLGLRLSTGVYGSTFFMLTGFHGLHVTIGAIMLLVIWLRVLKGHFTPEPALRLRSGFLVLALRRCRVARALYLRLLAVEEASARAHRIDAVGRNETEVPREHQQDEQRDR